MSFQGLENQGFIPNVVVLQQGLKQAPLSYLTCVFFMLLYSSTKNVVKGKELPSTAKTEGYSKGT